MLKASGALSEREIMETEVISKLDKGKGNKGVLTGSKCNCRASYSIIFQYCQADHD